MATFTAALETPVKIWYKFSNITMAVLCSFNILVVYLVETLEAEIKAGLMRLYSVVSMFISLFVENSEDVTRFQI